ncbi:hypothetical protein M0G43_12560 [Subsaxibacter sp. CAU 1640]|uniref:TolB family protein n=1 Tax=Subsaxibacter sp. CAU 1640 TaxID=2933271 RepID=UPI002002F150|nr:hypothetical protein [Subsaxibacter sp. CAU 1640]MCK7591410.1 hypothetical protein [Subsaxibacter sp. CAU 1640]
MKLFRLLLVFTLLISVSCSNEDSSDSQVSVTLEANGLSDDNLAINNYATFTATVEGYEGDMANLSYVWLLNTERGELSDGTNLLPSPTVADTTIRCYGRTAGDEQITVQVLDVDNNIIATKSMSFTVVGFVDPGDDLGCFDQPKLVYKYGSSFYVCNFDGSSPQSLDADGLSVAISPNGQWIAYNKLISGSGYTMYVKRCETGETTVVQSDADGDFLPRFSTDSQTLYLQRANPIQPENPNGSLRKDIGAYNLETGEFNFLTNLYQLEDTVRDFTVSPVTGDIAFFRQHYEYLPGGSYTVTTKLSILNPANGFISDFTTLPIASYNEGLDWSPDGEDIIFSASSEEERGIYRINLTDGSQPLLLFLDISPQSLPPLQPHYYANGSRIAWSGQENGQGNVNIWSIDANGNDLQQITDTTGNDSMMDVLE